jgi:hypothetical protein
LLTSPQVTLPQEGGVHAVQTPPVHVLVPLQPPHWTLPLPHAFSTEPHVEPVPPSAPMHSGGGAWQTPPMHCCPLGQEQFIVCPQPSLTVPHRFVPGSGLQLSLLQPPASPPSLGICMTHALFTQVWPLGHPGQLMGTPHGSTPSSPHLPEHESIWHDCAPPEPAMHTSPLGHGMPQSCTLPLQSV